MRSTSREFGSVGASTSLASLFGTQDCSELSTVVNVRTTDTQAPALRIVVAVSVTSGSKWAWVTGATRGVGRGIAIALGASGWTVWVTGRSGKDGGFVSPFPGTVEETAAAVDTAGGTGIARVCDHRRDDEVEAVVEEIRPQAACAYSSTTSGPATSASTPVLGRSGTRPSGINQWSCGTPCSTEGFERTT